MAPACLISLSHLAASASVSVSCTHTHTHTHIHTHTHTSSTYSHGGKKHKPPSAPVCFPQQCEFQQIIQDPLEFKVDCFKSNRECDRQVCSHCTPSLGPHGMQGWCPEWIDWVDADLEGSRPTSVSERPARGPGSTVKHASCHPRQEIP